jgi:micrococcal nuclease
MTARFAFFILFVLPGVLLGLDLITVSRAAERRVWPCRVVKITDGDTLQCEMIPAWPEVYTPAKIRVSGVDTPESRRPPARCNKEVRLGLIAKAEMKRRVPIGSVVGIKWTGKSEKYGRVLADVTLPDGKDWALEMIRLGMALRYDGQKKSDWCK